MTNEASQARRTRDPGAVVTRTYLDFNATAPLRDVARQAMCEAMDVVGNPSSVHAEGRAAKALVERARGQVAEAVGCKPQEVIFTGGATEAAQVLRGRAVEVDPTAHDAVWAHHAPGAAPQIYAMGLANSETGIITEPPAAAARGGALLMLDVTQAIGRIPFSFAWSGADMAILSAHKLGGPKGVGALILRQGVDIEALSLGGGQEMGRRSGTENIIGIAGFAAAIEAAVGDLADGKWHHVEKLRKILELSIEDSANDTIFVGKSQKRLPNTSCVLTEGWKGETQVMQMDLAGFAISAGSACSSGKVKASRVLSTMGFNETQAASAIRVSLGPDTTEEEIVRFAESWLSAWRRYRARAA